MGKTLVFIYNDMADFEITFTCSMLNSNLEDKIVPIGYEMKTVKALSNLLYTPAMTVKEALECDDIGGLIIPGGYNDEQRPELTELIKKVFGKGKLTAAICAGPKFLAVSGVLEGRKYTTTLTPEVLAKDHKEDPFNRDNFVNKKVVRDGNIITAVGSSFIDFTKEILDFYGLFADDGEKKEFTDTFK